MKLDVIVVLTLASLWFGFLFYVAWKSRQPSPEEQSQRDPIHHPEADLAVSQKSTPKKERRAKVHDHSTVRSGA